MARLVAAAAAIVLLLLCFKVYTIFTLGLSEYAASDIHGAEVGQIVTNSNKTTECVKLNSEEWLRGPLRSNFDSGMGDSFVYETILRLPLVLRDGAGTVLSQSLCHKYSRFRNESDYSTHVVSDDKSVRMWAVRLVYLSFHYHQHRWAIPEANQRLHRGCPIDQGDDSSSVGKFDFECPDAKFLMVPLKGHGLGANVRTDIIPALLVALIANRVAVFVNHAPNGDVDVVNPWPLASCERLDYQCFFLPETPCTLTHEDIAGAHVFSDKVDFRRALKKSVLPSGFDHHKVWLFKKTSGHTVQLPALAVERLQNYSNYLASHLPADDPRLPTIRRAIQAIGEEDPRRDGVNYAMANLKVHHALGFYALRPNLLSVKKLDEILNDVLPADFETSTSVGLPVRGSDKCRKESECLTFHEYMQASAEVWIKYVNSTTASRPSSVQSNTSPTVLFTTESTRVVQEQKQFAMNMTSWIRHRNLSFTFNFVSNSHDVTPNTGYLPYLPDGESFTADDAMLSAISSFRLQLMAQTTVGNCCSNFHHLLNDFLTDGCGAARDNVFMCLQESRDPSLRVCCAWHKDCRSQKAEAIQDRAG